MRKILLITLVIITGFAAGVVLRRLPIVQQKLSGKMKADSSKYGALNVQIIIKGILAKEFSNEMQFNTIVLKTDTAGTYVLFNPPYVNALTMNKLYGKTVKLKGLFVPKTKYKDSKGIYIQDILEVQ
jgi:hypothetical protein